MFSGDASQQNSHRFLNPIESSAKTRQSRPSLSNLARMETAKKARKGTPWRERKMQGACLARLRARALIRHGSLCSPPRAMSAHGTAVGSSILLSEPRPPRRKPRFRLPPASALRLLQAAPRSLFLARPSIAAIRNRARSGLRKPLREERLPIKGQAFLRAQASVKGQSAPLRSNRPARARLPHALRARMQEMEPDMHYPPLSWERFPS